MKSGWGRELRVRGACMQEMVSRSRLDSASRVVEDGWSLPPLGGSWKRTFDVAIASVAIIALMPLMLATAAIVRLLTEKSTILSERLIGRKGRTFVGYRFRIPVATTESNGPWAQCLAEALHRSRLDQLPRFFNVIRGDMSLIGPRPRAAVEFGDYFARAPECLLARPGLISIGQGFGRGFFDPRTEIALDRYYVSHWSIGLDLALLSKSIVSGHRDDRPA